MAARRKSARGKPRRKTTRPARRAKAVRKPARPARKARRPAAKRSASAGGAEAVARTIVKATSDPSFPFATLYTEDCVSEEASGESFRGHAGLEQKGKGWEEMQQGVTWKARNVFVKGNTICIEWAARVQLRDGRTVDLKEVAIHELRGDKIARERYYYNPLQLAPPGAGGMPS
jgi:hypothetical protein